MAARNSSPVLAKVRALALTTATVQKLSTGTFVRPKTILAHEVVAERFSDLLAHQIS